MRAILREKLLWFLVLGGLVFVADHGVASLNDKSVEVKVETLATMVAQWQARNLREPSAAEMENMIADYVREEILVREALKLQLEENDTVVRRRLAQKMEYLLGDTSTPDTPTPEELRAYYETYMSRYRVPAGISFRHIYYGDDHDAARHAATTSPDETQWQALGQPFMQPRAYNAQPPASLHRIFGEAFVDTLQTLASSSDWQGPVQSGYGWHIVQVQAHIAVRQLPFDEVESEVAQQWYDAQARHIRDAAWRDLSGQYHVYRTPEVDAVLVAVENGAVSDGG